MSISKNILLVVSGYHGHYREVRKRLGGYYSDDTITPTDNTIRVTLSKLKKQGLVDHTKGTWGITTLGTKKLLSYQNKMRSFSNLSKLSQVLKKDLVIIFDIPEVKRHQRNWLRRELVGLGFEKIQQSVWLGPALPEIFIRYLDEENLLEYVKFFKVAEKNII